MMHKAKYFLLLVLFHSCSPNSYIETKRKYPFFDNFEKRGRFISLNNFNKSHKKQGLEYLVRENGNVVRIHQWKDDRKEGYQYSYAANQKLHYLVKFVNDTMNGDYFVMDTISGKILEYREILNQKGVIVDNQIIRFVRGKVDLANSSFIKVQPLGNLKYKIQFFGNNRLPFLAAYIREADSNNTDLKSAHAGLEILSTDNHSVIYDAGKHNSKYAAGYLLNYRFPTETECRERGLSKDQKLGPLTYFMIKLR